MEPFISLTDDEASALNALEEAETLFPNINGELYHSVSFINTAASGTLDPNSFIVSSSSTIGPNSSLRTLLNYWYACW